MHWCILALSTLLRSGRAWLCQLADSLLFGPAPAPRRTDVFGHVSRSRDIHTSQGPLLQRALCENAMQTYLKHSHVQPDDMCSHVCALGLGCAVDTLRPERAENCHKQALVAPHGATNATCTHKNP